MFTPKANSKDKQVKKTQECKTEHAVTVQLAPRVHHSPRRVMTVCCREKPIFHPQNPNFESPKPKFDPMVCPNVYKHQKDSKPYKT